jgi:hypothetical protein
MGEVRGRLVRHGNPTHVIVMEDGDDGCAYLDDSIEALGIEMLNNLLERCLVGCVTKDCVGESRLCR